MEREVFHFLCQHEAFAEFTSLKIPGTLSALGPPFKPIDALRSFAPRHGRLTLSPSNSHSNGIDRTDLDESTNQSRRNNMEGRTGTNDIDPIPILQKCCNHFLFTTSLPALRDAKPEFWSNQVGQLLDDMADANLSDSYDKGAVSKRKVLGICCSVFLAGIARGLFGKVPPPSSTPYPISSASQTQTVAEEREEQEGKGGERVEIGEAQKVLEDWERFKREMVHGTALDEIMSLLESSTPFTEYPNHLSIAPLYIKLTIASLLHYLLVASPDGPDTLSLLSKIDAKLPWWTMRQTLKIPNALGMVQGLVKVLLQKTWLSRFNLLESIIRSVLGADQSRLEKSINEIEIWMERNSHTHNTDSNNREGRGEIGKGEGMELLQMVKRYVYETDREEQGIIREYSMNHGISIISAIMTHLSSPSFPSRTVSSRTTSSSHKSDASSILLPDKIHEKLLAYLNQHLSRRDRVQLTRILTSSETTLSETVRSALDLFYPIILELHSSIDLSSGLSDFQAFVGDVIKTATKKGANVRDFMGVVERHDVSFLKFASQILKRSEVLKEGYGGWYRHCLDAYHGSPLFDTSSFLSSLSALPANSSNSNSTLNSLNSLNSLNTLKIQRGPVRGEEIQGEQLEEMTEYKRYLDIIRNESQENLTQILRGQGTDGFGEWLSILRDIQASTPVTPRTQIRCDGVVEDINDVLHTSSLEDKDETGGDGAGTGKERGEGIGKGARKVPRMEQVKRYWTIPFRTALHDAIQRNP